MIARHRTPGPAHILLLCACALLAPSPDSRGAAPTRPDILFIAIDDLNDWVGFLGGNPDSKTPNIDRLAARGVAFTNAHCAAPACNPSRAALMSGLRPSTTGVYTNSHDFEVGLKDALTLTEHLRSGGYRICAGGKIYHHNKTGQRFWDEYRNRDELEPRDRPPAGFNGLARDHFDWAPLPDVGEEQMPDHELVTWAIERLSAPPPDKPLFLAVGIVKPHLPWYAPKRYFDLYPKERLTLPKSPSDDLADVPPIGQRMARPDGDHKAVVDAGLWRDGVQAYLATIRFVDDQIGRLLDALDRAPRRQNTAVVFWSDHGWHLGEKAHWRKFTLWEESTRAPMIIVAPGLTGPGGLCSRPVDYLSIYPTVCDIAGLPLPAHLQGPSLKPLLANPSAPWEPLALTTHGRGEHGVRSDRWRYIRYHDGTEELYDHSTDPDEWRNLAADRAHDALKASLGRVIPAREAPETTPFGGEGKGKKRKVKAKKAE